MNDLNSDEKLIHQCRLGDQAALDNIMNKYKPLVIKKSRSMFLIGGETAMWLQHSSVKNDLRKLYQARRRHTVAQKGHNDGKKTSRR